MLRALFFKRNYSFCSKSILLIILGILLFIVLSILSGIGLTNYGITNPVSWIVPCLALISLVISCIFATRIQIFESRQNKKIEKKRQKRKMQRKLEKKRAKEMLTKKVYTVSGQNEILSNKIESVPPSYEEVMRSV
uniref:LapA_dom domain-containing protein n=1 Tax=Parastrongyloides trichosuri TaxID=131310 RepID=A0A0N5A0J3_PARTI